MPRQAGPPKALAFMLLLFAALFACKVSAKYIKPKPSEFELMLPLACPDTCGIWCTSCPDRLEPTEILSIDEDGNLILLPLPSLSTTAGTPPENTDRPTTGGILELGDEDSVIPPGLRFSSAHNGRSTLSSRQNNDDIIKGSVSRPETWGAGPADWWRKMNGIIDERGLVLDNTPRSSALVDYFDLDQLSKPQQIQGGSRAGGVPALRGSILFVGASDLGIAIAHFWESPSLVAIRNDTKAMYPQLRWDIDMQDEAFMKHVIIFSQFGTIDFHNATKIEHQYRWVPNSPALSDLVRPGMILDHRSTQWREFRIFQPRDPHLGPPGTVAKLEEETGKLREALSTALNINHTEIIRHAPFYEGHGRIHNYRVPHKPTDWHNTFTYQYGYPEKTNMTRPDADRELRVTWNGEPILEMTRTWKSRRLNDSGKCRLHVTTFAGQTSFPGETDMNLRIRVIKEGDKGDELLWDGDEVYGAEYVDHGKVPREVLEISPSKSGLSDTVKLEFTRAYSRVNATLGEEPRYSDWHINFAYGDNDANRFDFADWETKETSVTCRGGSWHRVIPHSVLAKLDDWKSEQEVQSQREIEKTKEELARLKAEEEASGESTDGR